MARDATIQYPPREMPSADPLTDAEVEELVGIIDKNGLSGAARKLQMSRYTIAHLAARARSHDGSFMLYRARLFEAKFRGELEQG